MAPEKISIQQRQNVLFLLHLKQWNIQIAASYCQHVNAMIPILHPLQRHPLIPLLFTQKSYVPCVYLPSSFDSKCHLFHLLTMHIHRQSLFIPFRRSPPLLLWSFVIRAHH